MKTMILLTWVVLCCMIRSAVAMAIVGGGNGNTNAPADERGWSSYATVWGRNYPTVGPHHLLGTRHTAQSVSPGDTATFSDGQTCTVVSVVYHPNSKRDLAMIEVDGTFPSWLELLPTNQIVVDAGFTFMGNGSINGPDIVRDDVVTVQGTSLLLTNFVVEGQMVKFDVMLCTKGTGFVVQQSTSPTGTNWAPLPGVYTATCEIHHVSLPIDGPNMFYRAISIPNTITNQLKIGSEVGTITDGVRHWATNTVHRVDKTSFIATYDREAGPDEGCLTYGDSSDVCVMKDTTDGKWKIAGINWNSPELGPWSKDGGQTWFWGAMMDVSGLLKGRYDETGTVIMPSGDPVDPYPVSPGIAGAWAMIDIPWARGVMDSQQ